MDNLPFEQQKTTIQITQRSRLGLMKIKGDLIRKDGVNRAFDDIIQELLYYWERGVKKLGY